MVENHLETLGRNAFADDFSDGFVRHLFAVCSLPLKVVLCHCVQDEGLMQREDAVFARVEFLVGARIGEISR
jgi:hypothetical protein